MTLSCKMFSPNKSCYCVLWDEWTMELFSFLFIKTELMSLIKVISVISLSFSLTHKGHKVTGQTSNSDSFDHECSVTRATSNDTYSGVILTWRDGRFTCLFSRSTNALITCYALHATCYVLIRFVNLGTKNSYYCENVLIDIIMTFEFDIYMN